MELSQLWKFKTGNKINKTLHYIFILYYYLIIIINWSLFAKKKLKKKPSVRKVW